MADEPLSLDSVFDQVRHWLSTPNIVGLDVGLKTVSGKETAQHAVLVFVIEKKPMAALTDDDVRVPSELEVTTTKPDGTVETVRVPTDVVETGRIRLLTLNQKIRPCPGGYQIGVKLNGNQFLTGTLGVTTMWSGYRVAMTNAHVIAPTQENGGIVYQPDPNGDNELGLVNFFMEVKTYTNPNQQNPQYNPFDFAASRVSDTEEAACAIKNIYAGTDPLPLRAAALQDQVQFIGKQTTSVQHATIDSVSASFTPGEYAWFRPVLRLTGQHLEAQEGDSGAALVAQDAQGTHVVGLVMAAAENGYVFATKIPPG